MAFKILITNFLTALERLQLFLKKKKNTQSLGALIYPAGGVVLNTIYLKKRRKKKKNSQKLPRSLLFSLSTEQLHERQETA